MSIKILSIDPGFSDVKVICLDEHKQLTAKFKFTSAVATAPDLSNGLSDPRIIQHNGLSFYVGDIAVKQPSSSISDLKSFSRLQYFTPVLLSYVIRELDIADKAPSVLSMQISIAHLEFTQAYKDMLQEYLTAIGWTDTKITLVPQGISSKVAIDEYGATFPEVDPLQISRNDYLVLDVGFNTVDVVSVINGKASAAAVRGLEGEGIIRIADMVVKLIKKDFGKDVSFKEAKEVIGCGYLKIRGKRFEMSDQIAAFKKEYLEGLTKLTEEEFGSVLDKSDKMFLVGGGAYIFQTDSDDFIESCKEPEFYNAIGGAIAGSKLV